MNSTEVDHAIPALPQGVPVEDVEAQKKTKKCLTQIERLELENKTLQITNCEMQLRLLQAEVEKAREVYNKIAVERGAQIEALSKKYGFDPVTAKMQPDGTIVENASNGQG